MKHEKLPLTREFVLSRLSVDVASGKCYWKAMSRNWRPDLIGTEAGSARKDRSDTKYWFIKLNQVSYKRCYLVFLCLHNSWPALIDHIDRDSLNDAGTNLRAATNQQNVWNRRQPRTGKLLPMGVRKHGKRFSVRIKLNDKEMHIGVYDDVETAVNAYAAKRKELFGEFSGL